MIRPLADRVLVLLDDAPKQKGKILLPDGADTGEPKRGKVLAVGPGKKTDAGGRLPMDLKVGDVVYLGKYGGVPVELDGKAYMLIDEGAVFGVVE